MSTGVGVSSCCISGRIRDGIPKGRVDTIGGLPCYVAEPKDGSTAKTVIYITDIFGWELPNVRLHADNHAAAGFYCYIPDLHNSNSLPISFLQHVEPPLKDQEKLSLADKAKNAVLVPTTLGPWLISHREAVTRPLIDGFVNAVRMIPGTNKIGAIGFCWGGRYAILQAHGPREDGNGGRVGGVDAAFAAHPSLVSIPADFDPVTKPLSLAVGTKDSLLSTDQVGQIQDLMAKKTDVPHELRIYDDQVHGFALRGDWSSEKDKKSMDEAEKQGIGWFNNQEQHPEWKLTVVDLNLPSNAKEGVDYVVCDITKEEEIVNAAEKAKPTVVVHTAGIVLPLSVRYTRKARDRVFAINVEGTRRVLAAAKAAGAEAFVFTSSCCCVTDDFSYQYANVDDTWPTSSRSLVYGESKAAAEALVLAASDEKLATCAIRPSVLFGPDDYQLIPSIHSCIAKRETPWVIGSGQNLWDGTYVTNVADAHILVAENLISSKTAAGEAFFISNNEPIPFRVLCLAIWAHFGHYPPFNFHVPQSLAWFTGYVAEWMAWLTGNAVTFSGGSVKDACGIRYCNGAKAERILGCVPKVGIEGGIRISCQAYAAKLKRDELEKLSRPNGDADGH